MYWLMICFIRLIIWTSQFTFESYLIFIVLILLLSLRTNSIVILLLIHAFAKPFEKQKPLLTPLLSHFLVCHVELFGITYINMMHLLFGSPFHKNYTMKREQFLDGSPSGNFSSKLRVKKNHIEFKEALKKGKNRFYLRAANITHWLKVETSTHQKLVSR